MDIVDIRALEGPNIYSPKPVIRMLVDVGEFEDIPTRDIQGFNRRLLEKLPGLAAHHCCFEEPGGFLIRLEEGTYIPHVIEHVALELLNLLGQDVKFGRARRLEKTTYSIVFGYTGKFAALEAGRLAVRLVDALVRGCDINLEGELERIARYSAEMELGPSTAAIEREARSRGIPVTRVGDGSLLILGYGAHQKRVEATITGETSCVAVDIACNKTLTKKMLTLAGIPVPEGTVVCTEEEAIRAAKELGFPVVVKPVDGNQGMGVSLNLKSDAEVAEAFRLAAGYSPRIIVERYIRGRHYRVLVVGGRFVCAAERIPAHVVGDGIRSIRDLIEEVNRDPMRGEKHEKPLTKIKVDPVVLRVLARRGYTLDTVPGKGEVVFLRENGNLSTGGTAVDVTDLVCPENRLTAERAAAMVGLDVAGIDITTEDISIPIGESGGAVIEVNAAPGIRMHLYPSMGKPRPAAKAIVDMLFPQEPRRFPLVAVTGTNGKTTTVRMVARILSAHGLKVGMTCTDGVYVGGMCIKKGDCSGPESGKMVLLDPSVEAAVLEVARGGLIRGGLAYETADVGIITNITGDHLGQDGVNTLEDLMFVKSLVAEQVKPEGYAVLNADDITSVEVKKRVRSRVIFFSLQEDNLVLRKHMAEGGRGVYVKEGVIIFHEGEEAVPLMKVADIPAAMNGRARHNVQNALAAAAAGWALDVPGETICRALSDFRCDESTNPGRMNIISDGGVRIILDYGHNPAALEAVIGTARAMNPARMVGVIASPGDRRDDAIVKLGQVAGKGFQRIIIKEDEDLRGRKPGEVAALLLEGALSAGLKKDQIDVILKEEEAIAFALENAQEGDLIVIFYEHYDSAMKAIREALRRRRKTPAAARIV
ncbi:cyanophycin synthetase [Thermosediminibacter litoriperuensis]|uniref:Cyanophycin synthetase n=1 Tax=Thermosediminibacter litoriperuensis TaxID=291989 RepID=A0A5S5ALA3_9FIRM|nr:cyanophycin synthetase [Thermosediminibacter litoriperuensis]TYP51655.1 cyanophycin synthetase [Thermosediminibacter litoriperuensis]